MLKIITERLYLAPPLTRPEQFPEMNDVGITHVINVGMIPNRELLKAYGFRVCDPPFMDNGKKPPEAIWQAIQDFVMPGLHDSKIKYCVACIGGPRRSCSTAVFILMLQGISYEGAMQYLVLKVPDCTPIYACHAREFLEQQAAGAIFPSYLSDN